MRYCCCESVESTASHPWPPRAEQVQVHSPRYKTCLPFHSSRSHQSVARAPAALCAVSHMRPARQANRRGVILTSTTRSMDPCIQGTAPIRVPGAIAFRPPHAPTTCGATRTTFRSSHFLRRPEHRLHRLGARLKLNVSHELKCTTSSKCRRCTLPTFE